MTSTNQVKAFHHRQKALGRKRKEVMVTEQEWSKIKAYLKELRK